MKMRETEGLTLLGNKNVKYDTDFYWETKT